MADAQQQPEPVWLTEEEQQAWTALAGVIMQLDAAIDTQLRRDSGMTSFEYAVMAALSQAPERTLRISDLAAFADGSLPRVSQVLTRLGHKDWVRRAPDLADGRFTLAILTDAGYATVEAAAPAHVALVRRLVFDPLTAAQVRQLATIGARITHAIAAGTPDTDNLGRS